MPSLKHLFFGAGLVSLTACSTITSIIPEPKPADTVYRLAISAQDAAVQPNADAIIVRIDRPTVPRPLSGNDVSVSLSGNRLLSASGAEWAERTPDLIQGSVFDVFSSRPDIIGVLPVSGARTDLRVHLTVRNFEALYDNGQDNPPLAVVRYTATLASASNRNLLGSYEVRKTHRAADNRVSEIVKAQDAANFDAVSSVADWLVSMSSKTSS